MPAPYSRRDWQTKTDRALNRMGRGSQQGRFSGLRPAFGSVNGTSAKDSFSSATVRNSHIEKWDDIEDDTRHNFALDFEPVEASWNVTLNGVGQVNGVDYAVSGRTLSVIDSTDLFLGASPANLWTLQIQYDYIIAGTGVAAVITDVRYRQVTKGDATSFWPVAYNDTAWSHAANPVVSFGAGTLGGPDEEYDWSPANDLQVRATVDAVPGQDVTLTYYVDDGASIYWNGSLIITSGLVGSTTFTISGASVLDTNILAAKALDTNPANNALRMEVA